MKSLAYRRILFTHYLGELLVWAGREGVLIAVDQVKRTAEEAARNAALGRGIVHSLHTLGLAADLLLYREHVLGEYAYVGIGDAPEYRALGTYWKTLHPDLRWGGDFTRADPGHFSMELEGVK